ncbi:hypothetical protein D3C87_1791800 [compost metagenome]
MLGKRLASMVLPEPGGPTSITLWPPAAATSRARFAKACPFTSSKSGRSEAPHVKSAARSRRVAPRLAWPLSQAATCAIDAAP